MSSDHVGQAIIDQRVLQDEDLSANAKIIYGRINGFSMSNENGHCWAGDEYFSEELGVSPRTVRKKVNELEDRGYIKREQVHYRSGGSKRVMWPSEATPPTDRQTDSSPDRKNTSSRDRQNTSSPKSSNRIQSVKESNSNTNSGDSRNEDVDWQNLTPPQRLAKSTPNRPCPRIAEVFQYVREARAEAVGKQVGPPLQLTTKRHNKIRARLKEGWEAEHLKHAYEGCLNDEWHAEKEKFDIEYVFRDDEKVRDFLRRYEKQGESQSNLIESDKERYLN